MRPFDTVRLIVDLPDDGIPAYTEGVIVETLAEGKAFLVECFGADGKTLDVVSVRAAQITVILADFAPDEWVALVEDMPTHQMQRGQVGRIQERVAGGVYQVRFLDADGQPHADIRLHADQLMLLQWHVEATRHSA